MDFINKKVLVVGLGILGGGVSTVNWLIDNGAEVTVADLKSRKDLDNSINSLSNKDKINFVLGEHKIRYFTSHDIIVINPAVKIKGNKFLEAAKEKGVPILNDLVIFLNNIENKTIAVTGTRGKTTTTNWIAHFLSQEFDDIKVGGNSSEDWPLLKLLPEVNKSKNPAVIEVSSFQLELADLVDKSPDIAVITNIYRDHLNRHETMEDYIESKANIFKKQAKGQKLVLNYENEWTEKILSMNPKSSLFFISSSKLPRDVERGLYASEDGIFFRDDRSAKKVFSKETLKLIRNKGVHNLENFLFASLSAFIYGASWDEIREGIDSLPPIRFRQEIIFESDNFIVVNDTAATSPDASMAAIERFGSDKAVLISGGTDKSLDYSSWSKKVKDYINPDNLFLLEGSATDKMIKELEKINYFENSDINLCKELKNLVKDVGVLNNKGVILFSPGAASFEKFKNEFDRGKKFNLYSKEFLENQN